MIPNLVLVFAGGGMPDGKNWNLKCRYKREWDLKDEGSLLHKFHCEYPECEG